MGSSTWRGKKNEQAFEAEGRSRGGLSTKIHAAVDALGNPIRFILTQGQASEYEQANAMIAGFQADFLLADKGYDANAFIKTIQSNGALAVIPPQQNRIESRAYDKIIYKNEILWSDFFKS